MSRYVEDEDIDEDVLEPSKALWARVEAIFPGDSLIQDGGIIGMLARGVIIGGEAAAIALLIAADVARSLRRIAYVQENRQ